MDETSVLTSVDVLTRKQIEALEFLWHCTPSTAWTGHATRYTRYFPRINTTVARHLERLGLVTIDPSVPYELPSSSRPPRAVRLTDAGRELARELA